MKKTESNQAPYESLKKLALEPFRSGKSLTGKGGAFAPLLKQFLEVALKAELEAHISESHLDPDGAKNRKNGRTRKTIRSNDGEFEIETSRDRNGDFEPTLIGKRERVLADSLHDRIIGMYGLGVSLRDISAHIKEMYDMNISHDTLSTITDRILPEVKQWQSRALEDIYCIVWMDAIHFKSRH
jgi:transposase-like protein